MLHAVLVVAQNEARFALKPTPAFLAGRVAVSRRGAFLPTLPAVEGVATDISLAAIALVAIAIFHPFALALAPLLRRICMSHIYFGSEPTVSPSVLHLRSAIDQFGMGAF